MSDAHAKKTGIQVSIDAEGNVLLTFGTPAAITLAMPKHDALAFASMIVRAVGASMVPRVARPDPRLVIPAPPGTLMFNQ